MCVCVFDPVTRHFPANEAAASNQSSIWVRITFRQALSYTRRRRRHRRTCMRMRDMCVATVDVENMRTLFAVFVRVRGKVHGESFRSQQQRPRPNYSNVCRHDGFIVAATKL